MRPKVIFAAERHLGCNPARDYSPHHYSTLGALEDLDWADVWVFHIDQTPVEDLVRLAKSIQPDLVLLSYILSYGEKNIDLSTIHQLWRHSKHVAMLWQESSQDVIRTADQFNSDVEFHVVIDSLTRYKQYTHQPEKYIAAYDPRSPRIFNSTGEEARPILLGFAGTLVSRAERIFYCSNMWLSGLPLAKFAGQGELLVPLESYVDFLRSSRIQLNFSDSGHTERHYKGRVAEATLCGSMLMELENIETANIFEPMIEYVPFSNLEDLISKARYYLMHPEEAAQIAAAGCAKARLELTGAKFWSKVFERAKIDWGDTSGH